MAYVPPAAPAMPLRGIGGWLIFPMLGTVISPFIHLKGIAESAEAIGKTEFQTYVPTLRTLLYVELCVSIGLLIAWIVAAIFIFKHKRQYPVLFNALLLFTLTFNAGETYFVYAQFGISPEHSNIVDVGRSLMASLIWVPYMLRSKRVANTFVK